MQGVTTAAFMLIPVVLEVFFFSVKFACVHTVYDRSQSTVSNSFFFFFFVILDCTSL